MYFLSNYAYPETMTSTQIRNLTPSNVDALTKAHNEFTDANMGDGYKITITKTTATFPGTPRDALHIMRVLMVLLADQYGTVGHPYKSMHALVRKLNNPFLGQTWWEVTDDGAAQSR